MSKTRTRRCRTSSDTVVHVFVCLCRLLQLLKDESSASKNFYRLVYLDFNCKIMLRLELCLVLLTWNAIAAFSEEHVAKLAYRVLLLYLVVSSALER